MTELQLQLTQLIGKKELSFGCLVRTGYEGEIEPVVSRLLPFTAFVRYVEGSELRWEKLKIGHLAALSDFHRFLNSYEELVWEQDNAEFRIDMDESGLFKIFIPYDSSKDLLDQSEETLNAIISLIKSYGKQ